MSPEQAEARVRRIESRAREYAKIIFCMHVANRLPTARGTSPTFASVYPHAYAAGRELAEAECQAEWAAEEASWGKT